MHGPVFIHMILAVHYTVRDLLAWETQDKMTSISIDPNTFTLKTVKCINLEEARNAPCTLCTPTTSTTTTYQCDAHTYPLIPFILGGTGRHSTYLCLIEINIFCSVPVVLTVIKNVLSRPPTTPTTSATRVPDPLEDFATFVSFCSKVYADQGESDLYEAEWFTLIGPDLCAIRVTFGHRKNLC